MAVGLKRAHAQLLSQSEGLAVINFGQFDRGRLALCRNLAKETEPPRLMASFLVLPGELEGPPGKLARVLQTAGQEIGLA